MNVVTGRPAGQQPERTEPGEAEPPAGAAPADGGAVPTNPGTPEPRAPEPYFPGGGGAADTVPLPRPPRAAPAPRAERAAPAEIEPTTGAPISALPRRAPARVLASPWFSARPPQDAQATAVRSAGPEPETAPPVEDEPAFWLPIEEVHWDGRPVDPTAPVPADRRRAGGGSIRRHRERRTRQPRRPGLALAGLVLLSLLSSFFAWVSAEPLWLALGRGDRGTATVINCTGSGIGQRCRGEFISANGSFDVPDVWVTGALRLPRGWLRRWAVLAALAGPLLIAIGFILAV
jgi:hypothetical protein